MLKMSLTLKAVGLFIKRLFLGSATAKRHIKPRFYFVVFALTFLLSSFPATQNAKADDAGFWIRIGEEVIPVPDWIFTLLNPGEDPNLTLQWMRDTCFGSLEGCPPSVSLEECLELSTGGSPIGPAAPPPSPPATNPGIPPGLGGILGSGISCANVGNAVLFVLLNPSTAQAPAPAQAPQGQDACEAAVGSQVVGKNKLTCADVWADPYRLADVIIGKWGLGGSVGFSGILVSQWCNQQLALCLNGAPQVFGGFSTQQVPSTQTQGLSQGQ